MSEMRHCRMLLEYDGAPFNGWARQPGLLTVEGAILEACTGCAMDVSAIRVAGRTDAGVHAKHQVISLAFASSIPTDRLRESLNSMLHPGIVIHEVCECDESFDPRGDALSRAYEYRVLATRPRSPLRAPYVLHHPRRLDLELLQKCAAAAAGQHDFTAFTPTETLHRHFVRELFESRWEVRGDEYVYCVRGNSFLRHMVRVLVGTMLAVGRSEFPLDEFLTLLDGSVRSEAHVTAPGHALCLVDVAYREGQCAWALSRVGG